MKRGKFATVGLQMTESIQKPTSGSRVSLTTCLTTGVLEPRRATLGHSGTGSAVLLACALQEQMVPTHVDAGQAGS